MNKKFFSFACLLSAGFIVASEAGDLASQASEQVAEVAKTSRLSAVKNGVVSVKDGVVTKVGQGCTLVKNGAQKGAAATCTAACSCVSTANTYKYYIAPVVIAATVAAAYKTNATFSKWVDGVLGFENEEHEATA